MTKMYTLGYQYHVLVIILANLMNLSILSKQLHELKEEKNAMEKICFIVDYMYMVLYFYINYQLIEPKG